MDDDNDFGTYPSSESDDDNDVIIKQMIVIILMMMMKMKQMNQQKVNTNLYGINALRENITFLETINSIYRYIYIYIYILCIICIRILL